MKKIGLIHLILVCLAFYGCKNELEEEKDKTLSEIIVRVASLEPSTRSTAGSAASEPVVFTGNDILWYNETTKEIRFNNNASNNPANNQNIFNTPAIGFYINDEYLFSSMTCVNSIDSRVYNSLVFYYDAMGNKYYLTDGYPHLSVWIGEERPSEEWLAEMQQWQTVRDENMQKIASEWNRFIARLKKEGRYRN